ncbi:hypothetical+protein [Methylocapsa aurea]|uniref:YceD family protein n=1 Tax=Methylocapsa aurea TaxID=663610 RepID=UPI003D18E3F8
MSDDLQLPETPFSRPLAADEVPEDGLELAIAAEAKERAALAEADGLPALNRLEAKLRVTHAGRGGLHVTGALEADLRQICVVTLEAFDTRMVETIDIAFAPEPASSAPHNEGRRERERSRDSGRELGRERVSRRRREAEPEEPKEPRTSHIADLDEDAPDPLVDGRIDLGAIVAEFFALALDPYPRKPGACFAPPVDTTEAEEQEPAPTRASPFAHLRDALDKDGGN